MARRGSPMDFPGKIPTGRTNNLSCSLASYGGSYLTAQRCAGESSWDRVFDDIWQSAHNTTCVRRSLRSGAASRACVRQLRISIVKDYSVICNSAFRSPTVLVSYRFVQPPGDASSEINSLKLRLDMAELANSRSVRLGQFAFSALVRPGQMSFSPFPADLRISPVNHGF